MNKIVVAILVTAVLPAFAPAARAQSLEELFRKVSPSVVVVRAKGRDVGAGGVTRFTETGSGVLISDGGRVMTAAHVVNGMDEITVEGIGGEVVRATIVSANAAADVSLLQLERVTKAMRVATIGDSDTVSVGQQVMIVGAPYGLAYSMSVGWISARWPPNTIFRDMPLAEFLQTTATINTGNSGGPVFNMAGEVVAIVSQNISKVCRQRGPRLCRDGQQRAKAVGRPEGVLGCPPGPLAHRRPRGASQRPGAAGFLVKTVAQGSMASNMGLQGGDRIVTIDGKAVALGGDIILSVDGIPVVSEDNIEKIRNHLAATQPGTPIKMTVLRGGKIIDLTGITSKIPGDDSR